MKKFLAILLTLTFMATSLVPAMAEDKTYATYHDEYMATVGNFTAVAQSYAMVGGAVSIPTEKTNWATSYISGKANMGIYRIDFPDIPNDKQLTKMIFAVGHGSTGLKVLKMHPKDWDFSGAPFKVELTDPRLAPMIVAATVDAHAAHDVPLVTDMGSDYNRTFADITSYVQECIAMGYNYCYVAAGLWYSTQNVGVHTMTDSSYKKSMFYPAFYYSVGDLGSLEFVDSNPKDGGMAGDVSDGIKLSFSNPLESATAFVNDVEAECEIDGRSVIVTDFNEGVENKVTVNVTDVVGNTLEHTINVFPCFESADLKISTYLVSATGSKASTYNPSVSSAQNVIFQIPLPELPAGKDFESFTFKFLTPANPGTQYFLRKLPGDDWVAANLIRVNGDAPDGKMNIYPYVSDEDYKANEGDITYELVDIVSSTGKPQSYQNTADLTAYAKECYLNGQKKMWLAVGANSTIAITGIGDSSHAGAGRFHKVIWSWSPADPAKIVSTTIENGVDDVAADEELVVEFSTPIKEDGTMVTVNGTEVPVMIGKKTVRVDSTFPECSDVEVVVTVTDFYGISSSHTIRFGTGFKYGQTLPEIPVVGVYDVKYAVDANELTELSFVLLTEFDDINSVIEIRDENGSKAYAAFTFDAETVRYNVSSPVALDEGKTYTAVIKKGSQDKFENVASEDVVVAKFFAGTTPEDVFAKEDSYKLDLSIDTMSSEIGFEFQDIFASNTEVTVKIVHESGDVAYTETLTAGKRGALKLSNVYLSNSGKYTMMLVPANAPASYKTEFSFYSQDTIEALWDYIALNGTDTQIADNWKDIAFVFDMANDYTAYIKDMDAFGAKIAAARDEAHQKMTDANIAFYQNLTKNNAYFTAVEQASADNALKKLIEKEIETLKNANSAIIEEWALAEESEYGDETIDAFIKADLDICTYKDIIDAMNAALDIYRAETLLDEISAVGHINEIADLLANEETVRLLGIEAFMADYKALESTDYVDKAMKQRFATAKDFAEAFEIAVGEAKEAEEDDDDNGTSGGSSGGKKKNYSSGSSGTQIFSSAPLVQEPFNPFTDLENVSWAKEHIVKLYNTGVINGKSASTFAPNENITREEFAKLIVSMTKLAADSYVIDFADVAQDAWYANYINAAYANGVVGGIGSGLFGTGYKATRQDIAVMIVNALKAKGVEITEEAPGFNDNAKIADYAYAQVAFLNAKGVVSGDGNKCFNPESYATRAEVAVMLSKVNDIFMKEGM